MKRLILLLSLIASAFVLSSCSLLGIPIDNEHFPDFAVFTYVRGFDSNSNGYLSKKEVENAKSFIVWGDCYDLSGIEYLTNLESLSVIHNHCTDLSGVETLTNLKTLTFEDQCPDLSGIDKLTSLEKLALYDCVFSETFVFDNKSPVTEITFKCCVFEKGVLVKNDSVENVTFDGCGVIGDVVFADCDALKDFYADFDPADQDMINHFYGVYDPEYFEAMKEQRYSVDLSGCDNLDYVRIEDGQLISSVDLGDCGKLNAFSIFELYYYGEDNINDEATLNICGSPNIKYATVGLRGLKELDISDCPYLISLLETPPTSTEYSIKYETDGGSLYCSNENVVFIK